MNRNILLSNNFSKSYWKPITHLPSRYRQLQHDAAANLDEPDYAFEMAAASIRFGNGVTHEIGEDISDLGIKKVALFTDKNVGKLKCVANVCEALQRKGIKFTIFDKVRIEPSDQSCKDAINFALSDNFEAFVAVGGGSVMDTAKIANLYSTYPADDFLEYVNPPLGKGNPVPGPIKPMFAVPTTAGTASEISGVAIFDFLEMKAKTGIAHRRLKPTLAIIDPENTVTMPAQVTASSGFDTLCHSLESYTAIPYNQRKPRPSRPNLRPAYQGSNPISDIWSLKALELTCKWLPIAVAEPYNKEARNAMLLASTFAGYGFGNAGVHLAHGLSYGVASQVKSYSPYDYKSEKPLIPHGMSVILNAPAVFRFTGIAAVDRHKTAARIMGADVSNVKDEVVGHLVADQIISLMSKFKFPGSLREVGFTDHDIPSLVKATLPQKRVTNLSPRKVDAPEIESMFKDALKGYY